MRRTWKFCILNFPNCLMKNLMKISFKEPTLKMQKTPAGCLMCFPDIIRSVRLCMQSVQNPVRNILSAGGTQKFRVVPPSVPVLKDAGRKIRDFLGFSSFFSVFLTFLKFYLKQKQKDAKYRFRPSFRNRTGERPFQGGFQRVFLSENRPFFVFFKKIIVK